MRFRFTAFSAFIFLAATSRLVHAQQDGAKEPAPTTAEALNPDLAAIQQSAADFTEAFNRGDAKAVAAFWTADGEYIDEAGRKYEGREAIEKEYAALIAENPKATLHLMVESVRLLSADAAIEDGQALLEIPAGRQPTSSKYSVVHVKVDGRWLMASVRDTHVDNGSAYENIADLEWLIGDWTSEENGVKTESTCRWIGDKSFVERKYTSKGLDGAEKNGVQIIGWNAQAGHVQSWNFSPDGSFAVGAWTPTEDGWQASITGVTVDGAPTTAVNTMQRLDDDAYVWQSVERTLGETPLPDSDEVVIRRNAEKSGK